MTKYKAYTKERGIVETDYLNDIIKLTWHRVDGPAYINYIGKYIEYWIDGKIHRTNGPACIKYYDDNNKKHEIYVINGKRHRLCGPAYIEYDTNGNILQEEYYINNILYTKEQYDNELLTRKVQSL